MRFNEIEIGKKYLKIVSGNRKDKMTCKRAKETYVVRVLNKIETDKTILASINGGPAHIYNGSSYKKWFVTEKENA